MMIRIRSMGGGQRFSNPVSKRERKRRGCFAWPFLPGEVRRWHRWHLPWTMQRSMEWSVSSTSFRIPVSSSRMQRCSVIFWERKMCWSTTAVLIMKAQMNWSWNNWQRKIGICQSLWQPMSSFLSLCFLTSPQNVENYIILQIALSFLMRRRCCPMIIFGHVSLRWKSWSAIMKAVLYCVRQPSHRYKIFSQRTCSIQSCVHAWKSSFGFLREPYLRIWGK